MERGAQAYSLWNIDKINHSEEKMKTWAIVLSIVALGLITMTIPASKTEMHSKVELRPVTIAELERFHGHVGPNVALGARMGEHAVTARGIPKYFGLTVVVECGAEPPASCIIDGLQFATGATMGKKNIQHVPADEFKVTISQNKTDNKVTYTLKSSTKEMLKKWTDEGVDVEESGRRVFKMKAEELFEIE